MVPELGAPGTFNVRDFGACGDSAAKDTGAIQRAIDACHGARGGVVHFPPGTYLTGTLVLKSGVHLHVGPNATLLASTERVDYPTQPNPVPDPHLEIFQHHLIAAHGAVDIAIFGSGTINGSGTTFFTERPGPQPRHLMVRDWRPGPMLCFIDCRDVDLDGVTLCDSPCYSVHLIGCERVRAHGLRVHNNRWGPNTDGINPDCCRNVHISDCTFHTGDDCIAVKSHTALLGRDAASENITVTNCTMTTTCCGVRLGYEGDGPIRNCTFSNLVMYDMQTGIDLLVPTHPQWGIHRGPMIENVSFSNLVIQSKKAIFLWIGDKAGAGAGIRNVSIADLTATSEHACYIAGGLNVPIENVRLSNVDLTVWGEAKEQYVAAVPQPISCWGCPGIPHAFYLRDARGVVLDNVRVRWGERRGPWRSALRAERVGDLIVRGLVAGAAPESDAPALHLTDACDVQLHACRAQAPTPCYLRLDGANTDRIALLGCDLSRAREAFRLGEGVNPAAVVETGNLLPG